MEIKTSQILFLSHASSGRGIMENRGIETPFPQGDLGCGRITFTVVDIFLEEIFRKYFAQKSRF
jgi:hypothetical protein